MNFLISILNLEFVFLMMQRELRLIRCIKNEMQVSLSWMHSKYYYKAHEMIEWQFRTILVLVNEVQNS